MTNLFDELLNAEETCTALGNINIATLYRGIRAGRFPAPLKLGPGTSRWLRSEVLAVLEQRAAERKQRAA